MHMLPKQLGWLLATLGLFACRATPVAPRQNAPQTDAVSDNGVATAGVGAGGSGLTSMPGDLGNASDPVLVQTQAMDADALLKSSCAIASVHSQLVPSSLLFVIDRSGSMNCNPPPITASPACEQHPTRAQASSPSKWEITKDGLKAAIGKLPTTTAVGISYFSNDDSCGVNSSPSVAIRALSSNQLTSIGSSLDGTTPGGGTPLVGATILAFKHLHDLALAGSLPGNAFVVLLTDGQQSEQCSGPLCRSAAQCTDLLVQQEVPKAVGPGADIRTFVIGAPGSEPARAVLSNIAVAGHTALAGCDPAAYNCHFDMTKQADFAAALSQALAAISGETTRCELPLPPPDDDSGTIDLAAINVVFTPSSGHGVVVPQDTHLGCDAGANGWQYASGTTIRLCGKACAQVRSEPSARLDVVLGCPVKGPS